jgi:2-polyprenyl-3-methyl-5-hydroxy-6-metoxy-1,4-benzoquinol methylase
MKSPACPRIYASVLKAVRELNLPTGAKVLDAPCGDGEVAIDVAKAGFEVSGMDILSELPPEAKSVLGDRFRRADLTGKLPWPDSIFDLVLSVEGVEHLENPFTFVRETHRILRPGGIFLLTTPNIAALRSRIRYCGSSFYNCDPRPLEESARHPLHHVSLRTFSELRYLLHTSGFRLLDVKATHIKPISYAYAVYVPWIWIYTRIAFRKEKLPAQRAHNLEIRRTLLSHPLLFGENLLLISRRI